MLYMERNSCLIREHVSEEAHVDKWIIKAKLTRYWPVLCFSTLGSWPHLGSPGIQIGSPGISDENIFLQLIIIITTVFFQEYESSSNKMRDMKISGLARILSDDYDHLTAVENNS